MKNYTGGSETQVFMPWKNNCIEFEIVCECGFQGWFSGYFAYYVRCPECKALYEMPTVVEPRRVTEANGATVIEATDTE